MSEANFASESVWTGDNLPVLRGINSECIDLIYLDPPFNSNRTYEAPIGSKAAGASFKDAWTLDDVDVHEHGELADRNPAAYSVIEAARQAHGKGMQSYLIFMAVRLMEMRRVLKDTGSIYLHCDPTASHYLKLMLDAVFGKGKFRNEVIWSYRRWPSKSSNFQTMHDVILFYAGGDNTFNVSYEPPSESYLKRFKGKTQILDPETRTRKIVIDKPTKGLPMRDVWDISIIAGSSKERLGYPTQKPLALLERIVKASTDPGDLVLDPFCGCATALVVADRLGRQWAGIDLSPLAIKLVDERIAEDRGKLFAGAIALEKPPVRTDMGELPNYRTHRHRLYGEQEGVCAGCETHFPFRVMDVDHILPRSRGGTDHADNLQLLCSGCNRSKGSKTMAEWRATQ
ncbi:MAG: DNA methyltransferase [Gammaproteobacteria bacterium]|nr:DNA methyltransferase [Gammaproteobacteria bacterium]